MHSEADAEAKYVKLADESVCIGPPPSATSYLNIPAIISAAEVTDAEAIHPGYGFLSENADFAERVEQLGFVFIGPRAGHDPPDGRQGQRQERDEEGRRARACRAPTARCPRTPKEIVRIAREIGYPVIIKAAGGGGGRGMRVVHTEAALLNAVTMTRTEAQAAFGNPIGLPREVPREPAPHRDPGARRRAQATRSTWASATARCSAGTRRSSRRRRRRIMPAQAARQDRRALRRGLPQDRLPRRGHVRVPLRERRVLLHRDEHARAGRAPGDRDDHRHRHRAGADPHRRRREAAASGSATSCCRATRSSAASTPRTPTRSCRRRAASRPTTPPGGPGIRVDSHVYANYFVPPYYDSLIGKVIAYGDTREQAIARMRIALSEMVIEGIKTNIPLHQELLQRRALHARRHEHPLPRGEARAGGEEAEVMAWLRLQMEVRAPLRRGAVGRVARPRRALGHDRGCPRRHS